MFSRVIGAVLVAAMAVGQTLPAPHKAAEFDIHAADGRTIELSGFQGKVVLLAFIHTTCPHCQQLCQTMNQLYAQYGAQGFQPVAIAWNDNAEGLAPQFAREFHLMYPVGATDRRTALGYLGISLMDQLAVVPQMVWIDRKGMVRAQTPADGDLNMTTEAYIQKMTTTLLAEPAPPHRPSH
jgi:peroxiredoxin